MKTKKAIKIITIFIITVTLLSFRQIYAKSTLEEKFTFSEYSEEFKKWLALSEEEKSKVIQPNMFNIKKKTNNIQYLKSINNILKTAQLLEGTALNKYNLKDDIEDNIKIRNQLDTGTCWAFSSIAALESNLALQDKKNNKTTVEYDYSERHMDYATTRNAFLNDKVNEKGFTREPKAGGGFFLANEYFMNGSGAIVEGDMPFENNQEPIDISAIDKTVATTVNDIVVFPTLDDKSSEEDRRQLINTMKEHITNYGGIYTAIHLVSSLIDDYYNNQTGAAYCNNRNAQLLNHAVTIIGWDDEYAVDKFNTKNQPTNKGAWIAKNSWGEYGKLDLEETKEQYFEEYSQECQANGMDNKRPNYRRIYKEQISRKRIYRK